MRLFRSAQADQQPDPAPDTAAIRLLLIDDDEDEFRLLRSAVREMRSARYEIDWVGSYDEGYRRLAAREYDAYLVDYNLAGRSGIELIRAARAAGCEQPMIMLTGQGSNTVDAAALEAGATDFVEKGRGSAGVLERTLRYALSQAAIADALRRSLRQVSGLEALGRLLSDRGPTPDALEEVVRLIDEEFGLPQSSLYLMEDGMLRLAAARGHADPAEEIDPRSGRLASLVAGGRAQIVPSLTSDPSRRTGAEPMELCVPLIAEGEWLGVLNVALPPRGELSAEVSGPVRVIADRLAVALALNRAIRGRSFVSSAGRPAT